MATITDFPLETETQPPPTATDEESYLTNNPHVIIIDGDVCYLE